jgi:hypothetical protein
MREKESNSCNGEDRGPPRTTWPPAWLRPGVPGAEELPEAWREFFEERAAIREFDGGLPRAEAEAAALADVLGLWRQGV